MLDIEKLKTAGMWEIIECIDELYEADKVIKLTLEKFKTSLKETGEVIQSPNYTIKVNETFKLVPAVDIENIIQKYPIDKYPDMYVIKLSNSAGDIIKEQDLLKEESTKSVLFRKRS